MGSIKFTPAEPITRRMLDMTPEQLSACITNMTAREFDDMLVELDAAQESALRLTAVTLEEIEDHKKGITNGHKLSVKTAFLEGLHDLITRYAALETAVRGIRSPMPAPADDLPEFTPRADANPLELSFGRVTVMRLGTETEEGTDIGSHVIPFNPHTQGHCEASLMRVLGLGILGGGLTTLGWTMMPALLAMVLLGLGLLLVSALRLEETTIQPHPDRQW